MKEGPLQRRIIDMARRFGWKTWHVPAPMRWTKKGWVPAKEARGLPDLFLLHEDPPRLLIIEVKGEGGKLSDEQREFLRLARDVAEATEVERDGFSEGRTVGVYVATPENEPAIEQMLRTKVFM